MDALAALQYLPIFAVVAGALLAALAIAVVRSRRTPSTDDAVSLPPSLPLPPITLLLVALALGFGVLLLLPAMMILRYFPHWQVDALLIAAVVIILAPLGILWRARSF